MTFGKGCGSAVKDTWYPSTCPPFSPLSLLSCSTEELLFDPHWTVLQFFSLSLIFSPSLSSIATVFLWQATLPFDPPASKTKTRSCGRKGEKMKGRSEVGVKNEGQRWRELWEVFLWRLWGQTPLLCVPESYKEQRIMTQDCRPVGSASDWLSLRLFASDRSDTLAVISQND